MRLTKRLGLLAAAAAFTASTAAVAAPTFINILTGGTSGVYYPIGVALSQQYNKIDGAKTSVQATKASVENLNLLQAGRGEHQYTGSTREADADAAQSRTDDDECENNDQVKPNHVTRPCSMSMKSPT